MSHNRKDSIYRKSRLKFIVVMVGMRKGGAHGESLSELWEEAGLEWQGYCKGSCTLQNTYRTGCGAADSLWGRCTFSPQGCKRMRTNHFPSTSICL